MRFALAFVLAVFAVVGAACGRPAEDDCRRALVNVQKIKGIADSANPIDIEPSVRQCRSKASQSQVDCLIAARTEKDVAVCQAK